MHYKKILRCMPMKTCYECPFTDDGLDGVYTCTYGSPEEGKEPFLPDFPTQPHWCPLPIFPPHGWGSKRIIGNVHEEFDRMDRSLIPGHVKDWVSFYNGWVYGRLEMLGELINERDNL
jgi:hypothetical protein